MKVFVTGATGWVGSAVVHELLTAGHRVLGLTRSDDGAARLAAMGAEVHRGSLDDLESLHKGASAADGVIHTAFNHDFSKFKENCEQDRRAIEGLGSALEGSDRPMLVTSGVALLAPDRLATEDDEAPAPTDAYPRMSEYAAASVAARGVRVSVVRLAPSVHGAGGDQGFVPMVIGMAREKGVSASVGDGSNRWSAVHRLDAARVYRLALEHAGTAMRYHAVDDEGVAFSAIADVIARRLDVPRLMSSAEQATAHFGWFKSFAEMDMPASSEKTRKLLGWEPLQPGLIEDIDQPSYFSKR